MTRKSSRELCELHNYYLCILLHYATDLKQDYKCVSLVPISIGALAVTRWYFEYELPSLVRGLQCDGNESTVLNCSMTNDGSCPASSDASVICPGKYAFHSSL